MSTRKILNIVNCCITLLFIISLFLPMVSGYSVSLWDSYESSDHILPIVLIMELLGLAVFYVLQIVGTIKNTKDCYPLLGFGVTFFVVQFISSASSGSLDLYGVGSWLSLLSSVALTVVTILANFMSDEAPAKPQYNNGYGYYPQNNNPYGYQPPQYGQPQGPQQMPPQGYNNPNGQGPMYR